MACDETLYRRYVAGDDAGLEALMKKYGVPLTLYIDGYLHDIYEAEELMLDVFAYLFTKKPRIRDGGLRAYLYKAARHMALRRKSKRKIFFSLDGLAGEPDGLLLVEEVLYLTYFEWMSYAQAAEVTGKTVKQITNLVYRGKENLRKLLEREGITPAEQTQYNGDDTLIAGHNAFHGVEAFDGLHLCDSFQFREDLCVFVL